MTVEKVNFYFSLTTSSSKPVSSSISLVNDNVSQFPMTTSAVVKTFMFPITWPPMTLPSLSEREACRCPSSASVPMSETISCLPLTSMIWRNRKRTLKTEFNGLIISTFKRLSHCLTKPHPIQSSVLLNLCFLWKASRGLKANCERTFISLNHRSYSKSLRPTDCIKL